MFSPVFYRYLQYARPYIALMLLSIFAGVLKFSLALSLPLALGYTIDLLPEIKETHRFSQLWIVLGGLTGLFVLRGIIAYYRSIWSETVGHRTILDIRGDLLQHIQRLGTSYHTRVRTGETVARLINDLNTAQGVLERGIIALTIDSLFLFGTVIFLFIWDWRLATVSLFTLPLYGMTFRLMNPRLRAFATKVQEEMQELSGELTEKIAGHHVVASFSREKSEELRFFQRQRRYYQQLINRVRVRFSLMSIGEFLQSFGPILVIGYGAYLVANNGMQIGSFVAFYGVLAHLYLPTRRLADYSADLQERLAALERVFEVFDIEPDVTDQPSAKPLAAVEGAIEFDHVHFAYEPGNPVLQDVTFEVQPGEAAAFVGRSGAGKSTLVNLVPRFFDVTQGAVRIDGHDVRDLTLRSLRENIGIVHQDPILFSGTIAENILYGRKGAKWDEMLDAAQMAYVHEFVERLPEGYNTRVGERGITLSGGQKQRVSIARAFLRDPRILILDEATSNLDSGSEQAIQEALKELMRGRTTLVIAHRLSTIVDCDFVVVLVDGCVAQIGPHRELLYRQGPYRQYCQEQFGDIDVEALSRRAGWAEGHRVN